MPEQGFLASLFDVEFKSLITTKVIKVLYILSMIVIGLAALAFVVAAFANSVAGGLIVLLIVAPLVALLYLIYVRVLLEIVIAVFRIMETNTELVALQRDGTVAAAPARASPLRLRLRRPRRRPPRRSRRQARRRPTAAAAGRLAPARQLAIRRRAARSRRSSPMSCGTAPGGRCSRPASTRGSSSCSRAAPSTASTR